MEKASNKKGLGQWKRNCQLQSGCSGESMTQRFALKYYLYGLWII